MTLSIDWAPALNLIGFSFSMVFFLLVVIVLSLNLFGYVFSNLDKSEKRKGERTAVNTAQKSVVIHTANAEDEVQAAIAMALAQYFEDVHDNESNVLTLEKIGKRYTPWSSKIYGLNVFGKR